MTGRSGLVHRIHSSNTGCTYCISLPCFVFWFTNNYYLNGTFGVVICAKSTATLIMVSTVSGSIVKLLQLQNALGLASIKDVASGALATGALGDILLALAMCYYLRKWRTGYQEPDSLLNRLVHYALNTGVMTSTMSVLTLILVIGEVGDEFTQTNDGLGSLTTIPELARNVNVNPVEVNVQNKTINAGDQAYEVFDGHIPAPPSFEEKIRTN
ncbi:hypothetical protein LENED_004642 [Lentinula edodes]|uniref:DUF6534 domain-containing protein n=1 Tax=Lentinula edodes TaxID=5353 RepID=A0A1Q3E6Y4_LENED|nr:hypothetical protein LENED_004642 [Lentinula edodes]